VLAQAVSAVMQMLHMSLLLADFTLLQCARYNSHINAEANPNNPPCVPSSWLGTYDYGNSFYSFEVATVHIIVLQTFTHTGDESRQKKYVHRIL
jgi:hypothetical protein